MSDTAGLSGHVYGTNGQELGGAIAAVTQNNPQLGEASNLAISGIFVATQTNP